MFKTAHYWAIHKKACRWVWNKLESWERNIIAADSEHSSTTYRAFEAKVNEEAERAYNDPEFFANQPHTFQYGLRQQ